MTINQDSNFSSSSGYVSSLQVPSLQISSQPETKNDEEQNNKGYSPISSPMGSPIGSRLRSKGSPQQSGSKVNSPSQSGSRLGGSRLGTGPRFERDRKFWRVENQQGENNLEITQTNLRQIVNMVNCADSTLNVSEKVAQIFLENCKNAKLIFDEVVTAVDVVNSTNIVVICRVEMPTVNIERSENIRVQIPQDQIHKFQCRTSCSTDITLISIPKTTDEPNVEYSVPEQLLSEIQENRLVSVAISK